MTVKENELVTFKCIIKGASTPVEYVHWMLDSSQNVTEMSRLLMEYSTQESNYLTQSLLKLNATKSMNLKSVSCLTSHKLWMTPKTVTAFLNVLYEPSFTISREPGFGVPVSEGMQVMLKCEIDSNPSSSPIWIRDADNKTSAAEAAQGQQQLVSGKEAAGEPIVLDTQEDGSVHFEAAKLSDSGWYRCKTENKYGNFSSFGYYLNVRPAAAAASNPQQGTLAPLQQHQLNRNALSRVLQPNQAAPVQAAQVTPGSQLMAPQRHLFAPSSQSQIGAQSNMISNDQPAPPYANSGANSPQQDFGAAASKCPKQTIRIDGSPEIDAPQSSVPATLGRQLILSLRFCCNPAPTRVFWIHRHLAMVPGRMFGPYITRDVYQNYGSSYCYVTSFEIEAVKPEDIGTVYVFVSNEKGHAGAQIRIELAKSEQHNAIGKFSLI